MFSTQTRDTGELPVWSVVLAPVPPASRDTPQAFLDEIHQTTGLTDAFLQDRAGRLVVALGRHPDPTTPEAAADLRRARAVVVAGRKPFAEARLWPPELSEAQAASPMDLRNARAEYGRDAVYTLQVAIYGRGDNQPATPRQIAEFRRLAEEAAADLRAEGELAFYYHGPERSMVTVGVFAADEHDGSVTPPFESARLREARRKHPHNLLNGQGIRERLDGTTGNTVERIQPSLLVNIPRR